MKLKRTRIKIKPDIQENVPLFYNYIDAIKSTSFSSPDYTLLQSTLYESFAVIEAPSKPISGIIDYSNLKK
ncbi:MAG TPA: hypothetical protein DDZ96_12475 [Porphyromonadaceae bacterium]|jgi:hypothetical protein|nr:hypothetical protein [Porphyromonadaceae bacterium]